MAEWSGELRFAFVDADRVTFHTHPDEPPIELTPGRRYAAVFVEIADNEALDPHTPDRRPVTKSTRNPSNVAAILCKDPMFQKWASEELWQIGRGKYKATEDAARELIRFICKIDSRAELDTNAVALADFQTNVEIPYYRWARTQKHPTPG